MAELRVKLPIKFSDKAQRDLYETCMAYKELAELRGAENAKLRELVRDMWFWCYEGHMDSESQEWQMKHIDGVLDLLRELGVVE